MVTLLAEGGSTANSFPKKGPGIQFAAADALSTTAVTSAVGVAVGVVTRSRPYTECLSMRSDVFNDVHPVPLGVVDELVPSCCVHVVHGGPCVFLRCRDTDDLRLGAG